MYHVTHVRKFNIFYIKATFIIAFLYKFLVSTEIKVSFLFVISWYKKFCYFYMERFFD